MTISDARPVPSDLRTTLERTLTRTGTLERIVADAKERSVKAVYFVGVGGSWASGIPSNLLLQHSTRAFSTYNVNSSEFSTMYLDRIDRETLVVAASHSGSTPETVLAAQQASARGALVVGLATDDANPLAEAAEFMLTYGSERTITGAKYMLLTQLSMALLEATGYEYDYSGLRANLERLPEGAERVTIQAETNAAAIARAYAGRQNINVLATGPLLGLGYMLSVCYLVEMQLKHSAYFNSADFFHGPFELATGDEPYIVLAGTGSTRALSTRLFRFFDRYHADYKVLDAAEFELPEIDDRFRELLEVIPMASVTSRVAEHFEPLTGHNLDTRRYMHKVDY
jgi:fructoselysine 6-phosphate deglycase